MAERMVSKLKSMVPLYETEFLEVFPGCLTWLTGKEPKFGVKKVRSKDPQAKKDFVGPVCVTLHCHLKVDPFISGVCDLILHPFFIGSLSQCQGTGLKAAVTEYWISRWKGAIEFTFITKPVTNNDD